MSIGTMTMIFAALYLAGCMLLSIYASKKSTSGTQKDFYVASNSLGNFTLFLTSMATAFSAFAFMGQMGQVYNFGGSAIMNFMCYGIVSYPLFLLIGSKLWYYGKRHGYITPADFVSHRYQSGRPARIMVGLIIGFYFSIYYIVIQIQGCAWAVTEATGLNGTWTALIISVILAVYVSFGGMRAVAFTDVIQALFLCIAVLFLAFTMVQRYGGFSEMYQTAQAIKPEFMTAKQNWGPMFTGSLTMALSMPLWPVLWTKYYCAKDMKVTYNVATGCGLGTVLVTTSLPLIIVAGLIIGYPTWQAAQADRLIIRYVLDFTNPLVAAIVVGGLLSAAMSTADGLLLLISSIFTQDLVMCLPEERRSRIKEETLVRAGKIIIFITIGLCFIVSLNDFGQLVTAGNTLCYPGYLQALPIVVGGLYWKRANGKAMTAGLACGLLTVFYTTFINASPMGISPGIWGLAVNTIVFIAVALATPPQSQEHLAQFGLSDEQLAIRSGKAAVTE